MAENRFRRTLSRRSLLTAGAVAAGAGVPLLSSCSDPTKDQNTGQRNAAAILPSYVPVDLIKPDLSGNQVLMPGYYAYPRDPKPVFDTPPGKGLGSISILYPTYVPIPKGPPQNAFYAQLQKEVGADLKIQFVPSPDYAAKFATTIAGGDVPDVMTFNTPTVDQPKLMNKVYADLGPYLSGDAIKEFPYLANFPTESWKSTVTNGTIFAIPLPRAVSGTAMFARLDLISELGANPEPKSYAEFLELMRAVTDPKKSRWAFANTTNMVIHLQMMLGVPNGWTETGGVFTNAYGDDRTKQAIGMVADMVKQGLFHPDSSGIAYTRIRDLFYAGRTALISDGYAAWDLFVRQLGSSDVGTKKLGLVVEPKHDGGGDAQHFAGTGFQTITVIKKGLGDAKTKQLLNVLNFLSAPIGSAEHLHRKYGVEGTDFTFVDGVPTLNDRGNAEFMDVQYIADSQTILGPGPKDGVDRQHAWHERVTKDLVRNPTLGLYSDTYSRKGATLSTMMGNAQNDIIFGRKPLSTFDEAYASWKSGGGDKIAAEYADSKAAAR